MQYFDILITKIVFTKHTEEHVDTTKEEDSKINNIHGCGNKYLLYFVILSKTNNYDKLEKLWQCIELKENKLFCIELSRIDASKNHIWVDG